MRYLKHSKIKNTLSIYQALAPYLLQDGGGDLRVIPDDPQATRLQMEPVPAPPQTWLYRLLPPVLV